MKKHCIPVLLFLLTIGGGIFIAPSASADAYWDQRVSLFDTLPVYRSDIVFLGNSITDGGEFSELFGMPNIKNRGIRSDVIDGVRKRLRQVTSGHPRKIFLLIGINDVSHGHTPQKIAERYRQLVREIREQSPETELIIQSIMPINNSFGRYKALSGKEKVIIELNELLKDIAMSEGATFADLTDALSDSKGNLRREFTNDGLHLTGKGYKAWGAAIAPLVTSSQSSGENLSEEPDSGESSQQPQPSEQSDDEMDAKPASEEREEILPLIGSKVESIANHRKR